jgi:molybdopterin converting factor small subunit
MVIRLSGTLLRFVDYQKELRYEAPTLKDGIAQLVAQYPAVGTALMDRTGQVRITHKVFLNGENVERAQMERPVQADDVVDILTSITGG